MAVTLARGRDRKSAAQIFTASMADIVFLLIVFYVVSYAFSISLECATGGDSGPVWFVALRASVVLTLLTSAVLLIVALVGKK